MSKAAGRHIFAWNGAGYPDGRYRIAVAARAAGREVSATTNVVLSRTLSGFGILPTAISPNGDGRADSLAASFSLGTPALANLSIRRGTAGVVSVFDSLLPIGLHTITWPGGVRDGVYSVALTVTDATGPVTQLLPVRVDRVRAEAEGRQQAAASGLALASRRA